ncbi:MAG: hypothetical protein JWN46_2781 [Acidimicrobiales bacterium]|nr:hypothetical protein [Acidimicrobiales bacterium]
MTIQLTHAEIEELLGAYALDAVDGDEAEAIELHLRDCPRCRAEVAEHREVAALLAHGGAAAPDGVWGRILDELEPAPPALRVTVTSETGRAEVAPRPSPAKDDTAAAVVSLGSRRRSVPVRAFVALAVAAALIVAVLGVNNIRQSQRLDRMQTALSDVSLDRVAKNAQIDPAVQAKLTSTDGRLSAKAVVSRDGRGYLIGATALRAAAAGRTYQLWGRVDGTVISLGTFDGRSDVVQFQLGKDRLVGVNAFMVTDEKAPGVPQSKNRPLVIGTV